MLKQGPLDGPLEGLTKVLRKVATRSVLAKHLVKHLATAPCSKVIMFFENKLEILLFRLLECTKIEQYECSRSNAMEICGEGHEW